MSKVKNIEKRIWDIEGFDIVIKHAGKDVRGDCGGLPQYPQYDRMARNDMTVAEWKDARFFRAFPGYDVDVLDGNGNVVPGHTKLGGIRDSYSEE